jgi:hypothetical protein
MCSGVRHVWAMRDGKSVKMESFVRNDADIRARDSADFLLLYMASNIDAVITALANSHQIGNHLG